MTIRRTVRTTIGSGLAVTGLIAAAALPAQAASGIGWRIVSVRHFGAAGLGNSLYSVAATGGDNAWAFGSSEPYAAPPASGPVAEHWNGTSWQAATLPGGLSDEIAAASAPSASDVWAVSDYGGYVLHYNGSRWTVAHKWPEPALAQELTDVTAFSPSNVWVFGGPGGNPGLGAWHLQGSTWTKVTGIGVGITAASAVSPGDIWAFGANAANPDVIIEHYNGTSWQQVTSTALDNMEFSSILAMSATNVWATGIIAKGATFVPYLLHMNGTTWTRIKIPWTLDPDGSAPDGSGGLWITANSIGTTEREWVLHRTKAGAWSRSEISASDLLGDIASIPGTTSLWGAGLTAAKSGTGSNAAIWAYGALP